MAKVRFHHPLIAQDLLINVNPDQVTWAYGLNTAVYPTYGGEVVQILSVFFDDMTVAGTVATYAELEQIYSWFITYMQYATQGRDNPKYDQRPVQFIYYERDWQFWIWPKTLPSFRYGRDVVAPTWTLTAAVKEPDATFSQQIKNYAVFNAAHAKDFDTFGKATADFGTTGDLENNPFGSPDADPRHKGQTVSSWVSQQTKSLADTYVHFLDSYQNQALDSLPQFPSGVSKPPDLSGVSPTAGDKAAKGAATKAANNHS